MQLIVDDLHITGSDNGRGETILLLHGWGTDHNSFAPILPAFAGYRVIAPDLPGFGGSQLPPEPWGVDDYAKLVQHLVRKLKIDHVDTIIGHSFGGRIALELLGRQPELADKLILMASHGLREPKSMRGHLGKFAAKTGKILSSPMPTGAKERLRSKLYNWLGAGDYINNRHMRQTFLKVIKQDASQLAPNITARTLLLYGAEDKQTPADYFGVHLQQLIPRSELAVIEQAGHYVHVDRPDAIMKRIKEWLQ